MAPGPLIFTLVLDMKYDPGWMVHPLQVKYAPPAKPGREAQAEAKKQEHLLEYERKMLAHVPVVVQPLNWRRDEDSGNPNK